eukprot:CAMPEP_0116822248 /NCGR_PEP_ID=MMETSP0418-20121206/163_1 /TAXON_ID=1158023 /ORGANISM="Astrosyne radiata, Strain 13vi08-1A" /LENGTH=280 /DNA_ID=CAMNT_0004450341 /DNA_START=132 /DNA_END=974 /DNA_ORIENTATION=-
MDYCQVYPHNRAGIVAGRTKRSCFLGDVYRGWLGIRPVCDMITNWDVLTKDYQFGNHTSISPVDAFSEELEAMMARYRVGDGTGCTRVTPSRSSVMDSSLALFVTLDRISRKVRGSPEIEEWMRQHPEDDTTLRYHRLEDFARDLRKLLVPLGFVRGDWKKYARGRDSIMGSLPPSKRWFVVLWRTLQSYRTVLPRRVQDEMGKLLVEHGAPAWFIRTNQLGGTHPDVIPLAPTTLVNKNNKNDNEGFDPLRGWLRTKINKGKRWLIRKIIESIRNGDKE